MSKLYPMVITAGRQIIDLPMDDDLVAEHVLAENSYTASLLRQINQEGMYHFAFRDRHEQVFLDIGANIGLVSLYAYDACARIVAVEPAPSTARVLRRIAARFPRIEPMQVALAAADGETVFHVNDVNTTASSVVNTYGEEIQVGCKTLGTILKEKLLKRVDFCKVDIEGSEADCLTAAEVAAAKDIIRAYYVETHNCPASTWEHKLGQLAEVFAHTGYGKIHIEEMTLYAQRT